MVNVRTHNIGIYALRRDMNKSSAMPQQHKCFNVTGNFMRILALVISQAFFLDNAFAQKLDSIKYSNGYLYLHEYGKG